MQSVSKAENDLTLDQIKGMSVELPEGDQSLSLKGTFLNQISTKAARRILNYRDEEDYKHAVLEAAWTTGTAATYHVNVAGDAFTEADFENAEAFLTSKQGIVEGADQADLVYLFHPYGMGSLRNISGWTKNASPAVGALGVPVVGMLNGIPAYRSSSVLRNHTASATASAIATNVITITVPTGHGFVAGQMITTSGGTTDIDTAVAITSTTATTIVAPLTATDDASNGALTVTDATCWNALIRKDLLWQITHPGRWGTRVIPYGPTRSSDVLQVNRRWGRKARANGVVVLHSPGSSVT